MASYFTQFSFQVPSDDPARVVALYEKLTQDESGDPTEDYPEGHPIFPDGEAWGLPDLAVDSDDGMVWVHDDAGESSIDTTVAVVQWILRLNADPEDAVFFEWADGCSRPLLDAYHGGAALVTATDCQTLHTSSLYDLLAHDLRHDSTQRPLEGDLHV